MVYHVSMSETCQTPAFIKHPLFVRWLSKCVFFCYFQKHTSDTSNIRVHHLDTHKRHWELWKSLLTIQWQHKSHLYLYPLIPPHSDFLFEENLETNNFFMKRTFKIEIMCFCSYFFPGHENDFSLNWYAEIIL